MRERKSGVLELTVEGVDRRLKLARDKVAAAEMQVASQQREIVRLKKAGLPTENAQRLFNTLSFTLLQLRNHYEIFANLISPSPPRRTKLDL